MNTETLTSILSELADGSVYWEHASACHDILSVRSRTQNTLGVSKLALVSPFLGLGCEGGGPRKWLCAVLFAYCVMRSEPYRRLRGCTTVRLKVTEPVWEGSACHHEEADEAENERKGVESHVFDKRVEGGELKQQA